MSTPTEFDRDNFKFDRDIFISYAHLDNKSPDPDQEGWISYFHKCLNWRLGQLIGDEPRIWRDTKLRGNDHFGDEIVDQFPRVAFLVSVLSPRYMKSEWCLRELETFCTVAKQAGGLRQHNKTRVFKVVKTPIPLETQPGVLGELLGYDFFRYDDGYPFEYDLLINTETKNDFMKVLNDLARDISNLMKAYTADTKDNEDDEDKPSDTTPLSIPQPTDQKTIFLATTGFDLEEPYKDIRRLLETENCLVLPDRPLPIVVKAFRNDVQEMLARCDLAIHMIGKSPGMIPDGADTSIVEMQNELAARRSAEADLQRLIWMPPALETDNKFQSTFIRDLRSDPATLYGADLLESSLDGLKLQIHQLLNPAPEPEAAVVEKLDDEARQVYLIFDQQDLEGVTPLAEMLFNEGLGVAIPVFEGDPKEVRALHQENLRTCDAALIYFGVAKGPWFQQKLIELRKIFGLGRSEPFLAKYIFVAEPKTPDKALILTRDAKVIRHFAPFLSSSNVLDPFLNAVRQG